MSKKVKIFAISIIVLSVLIFAATNLGGSKETKSLSDLAGSSNQSVMSGTVSGEVDPVFSDLLSSISTIEIDTKVLHTDAYKALRDYPVSLGSDTVGRNNPFAPIGSDKNDPAITVSSNSAVSTPQQSGTAEAPIQISSGAQVQTLQPGKISKTSAEFSAQVKIEDSIPVSVIFQYGTTDAFNSNTAPVTVDKSGTAIVTVTNLQPKTKYLVRAVMVKGSVPSSGNTVTFTTQ